MEDKFDEDYYKDLTELRINMVFVLASLVANSIGTIANIILFGMSITTYVCMAFMLIILLGTILVRITKKHKFVMYLLGLSIVMLEFPFLYFSYREAAIPYIILGVYGLSIIFKGRLKYVLLVSSIIIDIASIAFSFAFPAFYDNIYEESGDITLLISTIVATTITVFVIVVTINILLYNYKTKNNEYVELNKRLERMNHYDSLTPCYNRKFLMDYLQMNCNVKSNTGLSIVLFDVIDLGYINFKYGYTVGDTVLSQFADITFSALRGRGIVARYDGQKFVAVIYATASEEIKRVVTSIVDEFKKYGKKTYNDPFNVSYGITICKSNFSVDDELKIVYARSCDYANKLPHREYLVDNDLDLGLKHGE